MNALLLTVLTVIFAFIAIFVFGAGLENATVFGVFIAVFIVFWKVFRDQKKIYAARRAELSALIDEQEDAGPPKA